jgi:hypothetical protein
MSDAVFNDESRFGANPIALADVLQLRVPVHWTEAVAVIEELCVVIAESVEPDFIPDAEGIVITSQGAVMVRRGSPGSTEVDAIGRTLNALLDPVSTPIPLRLFVAHGIGSEKYRSAAAFGEALSYYSRPDRTELIQALYLRCLSVPATPPPVMEDPLVVALPPVPEVPPPAARRAPRWAAPVAALLVLAVASLAWWSGAGRTILMPGRTLSAAATSAADSIVGRVREILAPVEREDAAPAAQTPATPARVDSRRRARAPRSDAERPVLETTTAVVGIASAAPAIFAPAVILPTEPGESADGALALPPPVLAAADATVYSVESPGVLPPVIYSPKLPPLPAADPAARGTNTMELLIDETGAVQHAKLTSTPMRMSDMMLLSPAKTWKFHPALKDGRPVKYRLTMSWVVAPP